eukprot:EG_transcript_7730
MRGPTTVVLLAFVAGVLLAAWLHSQGHFLAVVPDSIVHAVCLALLFPAFGLLFRNIVLVHLFLPALLAHRFTTEWVNLERMREMFLAEEPAWEPLPTATLDGVRIDAMLWRATSTEPAEKQKWLIWCNANAVCYEELMGPIIHNLGKALRCNVALFNYRGVGNSARQWPLTEDDLYDDARAVYRALLRLGADAEKILIYGHSLGSAVGASLRRVSPGGPFCSDRSFSSLAAAAAHHAAGESGLAAAILIGVYFSVAHYGLQLCCYGGALRLGVGLTAFRIVGLAAQLVWALSGRYLAIIAGFAAFDAAFTWLLTVVEGRPPHLAGILLVGGGVAVQHVLLGEVVGALFWASGVLRAVCPWLLRTLGWEMDQVAAWKSFTGKKLLIYHPGDGLIPPAVSLYEALLDDPARDAHSIALRKRWETLEEVNPLDAGQKYHNYDVASADPGQWVVLRQRIGDLLK